MLKALLWVVAVLLAAAGIVTPVGAAAPPRPDYVTPSIVAYAGLVVLSHACAMPIPAPLVSAKTRLQSLAARNGWSGQRFGAAYASALALAVRWIAATRPDQRAPACARLRAMASAPPRFAPTRSVATGNQPALHPFDAPA